jgi:hypothetical protein
MWVVEMTCVIVSVICETKCERSKMFCTRIRLTTKEESRSNKCHPPNCHLLSLRFVIVRIRSVLLLLLLFFGIYSLMFFMSRSRFTITVDLECHKLICWYFSDDPQVNRIAFDIFRPWIMIMGGVDARELESRDDALLHARNRTAVYFRSL